MPDLVRILQLLARHRRELAFVGFTDEGLIRGKMNLLGLWRLQLPIHGTDGLVAQDLPL